MAKTKEARSKIYEFIKSKGIEIDKENHKIIRDLIKRHDDIYITIFKIESAQRNFALGKINSYISKAGLNPQNPKIAAQKEALQLCRDWLVSDIKLEDNKTS